MKITEKQQKALIALLGIALTGAVFEISDLRSNLAHIIKTSLWLTRLDKKSFQQIEFEKSITDYLSKKVQPEGNVSLPAKFSSQTVDGKMYVTKRPSRQNIYLFIVWLGRSSDFEGYVYCDDSTAIFSNTTMEIMAPVMYQKTPYGLVKTEIEESIASNWHKARCLLH